MSKIIIMFAIAGAVLTGCAGGVYDADPLQRVKNDSMAVVDAYSASVTVYLTTRTEADALEAAKGAAAYKMKDPASAQFRNVRVAAYGPTKIVCGEINAKNAYGGYVGFVPFVASTTAASFLETDSRYPQLNIAMNVGITTACL